MSRSAGTFWPSMSDYQEAVQSPSFCFFDPELQAANPVCNKLGLPRPICGNFASVYEFEHSRGRWAIKCFLRNIPDLHKRYEKISDQLHSSALPYFCTFDYLQKGIKVQGKPYPLVKMEWVAGEAFNHYLEARCRDRAAMDQLEESWLQLLVDLKGESIAHTDLQHGNVIVKSDGSLHLIDYDGMWVPKLKGQRANENGHPDYQSPLRNDKDFHADLDDFAGTVIHVAIRALQRQPGLWDTYDNGDNVLFRRADFVDPSSSALFQDLRSIGDEDIDTMLDELIRQCGFKVKGAKIKKGGKVKRAEAAKAAAAPPAPPRPAPAAPPRPAAPAPARVLAKKMVPSGGSGNAASPAASAPAPPPPVSGPSWLSGHVTGTTGTTPAAPRPARVVKPSAQPARSQQAWGGGTPSGGSGGGPRKPRNILGWVRLAIHLLVFIPVATVLTIKIVGASSGRIDPETAVLIPAFGSVTLMGLIALPTLGVLRRAHPMAAILFFGFSALLMTIFMVAGLLNAKTFGWSGDNVWQCILMVSLLSLSIAALIIEPICQRRG